MRAQATIFCDHMQRLDGVIEIDHDYFFFGVIEHAARDLNEVFGVRATLRWR